MSLPHGASSTTSRAIPSTGLMSGSETTLPKATSAVTAVGTLFRMASSLPPVPPKLVKKIQALEFVEMRELLPDNMALADRLEALLQRIGQPTRNPEQREIGSLYTWTACFTTYIAVVSQAHPGRVVDMLAYMRLIIREAHRHGGNGWLTYDAVFRCNQQGLDTCGTSWTPPYTRRTLLARAPLLEPPASIAMKRIIRPMTVLLLH